MGLTIWTGILVAALGAANGKQKPSGERDTCSPDAEGYCSATVVYTNLTYENPDAEIKLDVGLGGALTIQLPKELDVIRPPMASNPIFEINLKAWEQDRHHIELRVLVPEPPDKDDKGERGETATPEFSKSKPAPKGKDVEGIGGNLLIDLAEPFTLTVHLRITLYQGVSRVIVTCQEGDRVRAAVSHQIGKEREQLDKEHAERVSKLDGEVMTLAKREMASALIDFRQCNEFRMRRMRAEDKLLSVFGLYLCRYGSHVYLGFRLENTRKDVFHLASVRVLGDGDDMHAGWVFERRQKSVDLEMDDEVVGVAFLTLTDTTKQPKQFALEVTELGGANRVVTLKGFDF